MESASVARGRGKPRGGGETGEEGRSTPGVLLLYLQNLDLVVLEVVVDYEVELLAKHAAAVVPLRVEPEDLGACRGRLNTPVLLESQDSQERGKARSPSLLRKGFSPASRL